MSDQQRKREKRKKRKKQRGGGGGDEASAASGTMMGMRRGFKSAVGRGGGAKPKAGKSSVVDVLLWVLVAAAVAFFVWRFVG